MTGTELLKEFDEYRDKLVKDHEDGVNNITSEFVRGEILKFLQKFSG